MARVYFLALSYPNQQNPVRSIFIHELAKGFVKIGSDVVVITKKQTRTEEAYWEERGVKIRRIRYPKYLGLMYFFLTTFFSILRTPTQKKPQIIHSHYAGVNSIVGLMISKLLRIPHVVSTHGADIMPHLQKTFTSSLKDIFVDLSLKYSDCIICNSWFTVSLAKLRPTKKISVINPGVDLDRFFPIDQSIAKSELNIENHPVLLSVGGLNRKKGQDTVVKILPRLLEKFPKIVYLILGRGPEEENLKMLVKKLNVDQAVKFIKPPPLESVPMYFNACDVFLLMSRTVPEEKDAESFGIVYLEASACGKPVIAGKSGGTGEAVEEGVTGFRIDPWDTEALTDVLVKLLDNPKMRTELGKRGRNRAVSQFGWATKAKETIEIYKKLLEKKMS
ncbi:MAG: glycosyltransferase [Candidatus Hermodarchaeota archaeon]